MRRTMKRLGIAAALAALAAFAAAAPRPKPTPAPPAKKAVKARAMLDVVSGALVPDAVVLVEGDRITAAGPRLAIPTGYEVLDLGEATLLPGLIDCHTHVTTTYRYLLYGGPMQDAVTFFTRARKTVDAGFTDVRRPLA